MPTPATLVVLLAGSLTSGERADVFAHAKRRDIELVAPRPTPPSPYPPYRPDVVWDLEGRLDEARTLAASLDEESALATLAALERSIARAPELPQSSFLMAERHRIEAELRRHQPGEQERVLALTALANALEGRRAAAFGDGETAPPVEGSRVRFRVTDLGPRDTLEIDGDRGTAERDIAPGMHHARVLRNEELVWAGYVDLTEGRALEQRLGVPAVIPCSAEDFGQVEATGRTPRPETGVACPRWLAVRRSLGGLEVADCSRNQCGAFTPLPHENKAAGAPLPGWAGVAIAGAATAATIIGVLWATGSLDADKPPDRTVFVYRGLQ